MFAVSRVLRSYWSRWSIVLYLVSYVFIVTQKFFEIYGFMVSWFDRVFGSECLDGSLVISLFSFIIDL